MLNYEGIFDGETIDYKSQINEVRKQSEIDTLARNINNTNDPNKLRELYSNVLLDDNVEDLLTKLTSESCFLRDFPEFYTKNRYGEGVINCSQNNSYHRYGVFKHILATISSVGKNSRTIGDSQMKLLKWTMLLHDIGKPYVKFVSEDGTESFAGHDDESTVLAEPILERFAFTEQDKHLILTLIKYHDKFLNEGEIIYDNMKILAEELGNRREYFYMLIEVKDADAAAKSIEVYNKYKMTRNKFLEFADLYFEKVVVTDKTENDLIETNSGIVEEDKNFNNDISSIEYDSILEDLINKNRITTMYQPIVDVQKMCVMGYEIFTKIDYEKKIDIEKFLKYTAENNKYDTLQQTLFINAIESFENVKNKEANKAFFNVNVQSYEKYVNKPRIYDAMNRFSLIVEFNNYDRYDDVKLQEKVQAINDKNGKVCLDNFGVGVINVDDLRVLNPNYIKIDRSIIRDIMSDEKKQKFITDLQTICLIKDIDLIAVGVENKEVYNKLKNLGIRYMQGYYISSPSAQIDIINGTLETSLNDASNESIV